MKCGPAANKFGEFLVKNLYDESIEYFDLLVQGHWKAPSTLILQDALKQFSSDQINVIRDALIRSLGAGLHQFLFALDELGEDSAEMAMMVDGVNIVSQSDGLHGETFGEDGWMAKYGKSPAYFINPG